VVSESRVTWATSVPILVFLGLSVLELGPMYATDRQTDRQTDVRRQTKASLNASALWGRRHKNGTLLLPISSPNIGRFSKFFHQQTQQWSSERSDH